MKDSILMILVSALFFNCSTQEKQSVDVQRGNEIVSRLKKSMDESPTKEVVKSIAKIMYVQGMNEQSEGSIMKIWEQLPMDSVVNDFVIDLNTKGDSISILMELFYSWDRDLLVTNEWVDRGGNNIYWLQVPFEQLLTTYSLSGESARLIVDAYNYRHDLQANSPNNYSIFTQNMVAEAVVELDFTKIPVEVKEVYRSVVSSHNGKISSNGMINRLRKKLGMELYL